MPQLTNVERAVIISKLEDNWSLRRIAAHMHVSKSCVFKIKTIWQTEQRTEKRARPNGLRKISNEEEDQALIQYVLENPFTTSVNACAETHFPGCSKTARRRLKEAGIHNHAPARKPFLTEVNKQNRLNFANEFINRDEDFWTSVIFSDEKTFQSCYNGRLRVYRPRNTRYDSNYIHSLNRSGRFSVSVWGWISADGIGVCHRIPGTLTALRYRDILENIMLPSVRAIFNDNFVYQQDNSPIHTANIIRTWCNENHVDVLPWPAKSPDLNPIENVWAYMVKRIYHTRNIRPANTEELWQEIQNAWEAVRQNYDMRSLIGSMRKRLQHTIAAHGGSTKY